MSAAGEPSAVLEVVANVGDASPREALEAWLEYAWAEGGGLPAVVVPLRRDADGRVVERLLAPSAVREELVAVDRLACTATYAVCNPGLLTCPVSQHRATVGFERNDERELEMRWRVELTPLAGWDAAVRAATELGVSASARAFQARAPRVERVGIFQLRDYAAEQEQSLSYGIPVGFRSEWLR